MEERSHQQVSAFFKLINNPVKFRLFLLKNLPSAYFSGVRVRSVSEETCTVTIPFKWFTRNPFRSTYFACLSMAAEMSTGVLAMAHCYKRTPAISLLVTGIEGNFIKKATGRTKFVCKDGLQILSAIEKAAASKEGHSYKAMTSGYNEMNELVAEFAITWSFKRRK